MLNSGKKIRALHDKKKNIPTHKLINQSRAPGGHIQITIMIDTHQQYK
jgi:hypothetical protein